MEVVRQNERRIRSLDYFNAALRNAAAAGRFDGETRRALERYAGRMLGVAYRMAVQEALASLEAANDTRPATCGTPGRTGRNTGTNHPDRTRELRQGGHQ